MLNNMKVLLGLLIVIGGLAFWATQVKISQSVTQKLPLIPAWQADDAEMAQIDRVVLSEAGEQTVMSKDANGHWLLNGDFYASVEPIFELFQSLKAAEIVEAKTANPDNHALVELADDDLSVSLWQGAEQKHAFHLGKQSSAGLTFVRRANEDQSYTVKGLKPVSFNADNWKLKTVLDISPDEILVVKVQPQAGETIEVARNAESGEFELLNIPPGFKLITNAYLGQLANGLSRLMIDAALAKDLGGQLPLLSVDYQLVGAAAVNIKVYQIDDSYYMTIDSALYPQYQDWMFAIAEYKFKALNRQLAEFIEAESEGAEAESESDVE